jgi:hypothetical protein
VAHSDTAAIVGWSDHTPAPPADPEADSSLYEWADGDQYPLTRNVRYL